MPAADPDNATEVLLTRSQAARRIGVSLATVRRMEGTELNPIVVGGKHLFRADEIERYASVDDGEVAARVFELFEAGGNPVNAVIQLRIPPERVRQLHSQWAELSGRVASDAPTGALGRFLRNELGRNLTPAAIKATMLMLWDDSQLRHRWIAYINIVNGL